MNIANLPSNKDVANKVIDAEVARDATRAELGLVGSFFGGKSSVPYYVAAMIALGTFLAIIGVIALVSDSAAWSRKDIATFLLSLLTLTLGYLFGKAGKP